MSKTVKKNTCSDFAGHFGVPPGLQFSPKFEYFWPKTWVIMWWFTPFLNWADILTVKQAIVVLVIVVRRPEQVSRRAPFFQHVSADISGCG